MSLKTAERIYYAACAAAVLIMAAFVLAGAAYTAGEDAGGAVQEREAGRQWAETVAAEGGEIAYTFPSPPAPEAKVPEEALPATETEQRMIAQTVWAEARGVRTRKEQAAVVWCILNRLDAGGYGSTLEEVVSAPKQFAWREENPVREDLLELTKDVLRRWQAEKEGWEDAGRVLPAEYLFFEGDGRENHFRDKWKGGREWDWSLPDPYEENRGRNGAWEKNFK